MKKLLTLVLLATLAACTTTAETTDHWHEIVDRGGNAIYVPIEIGRIVTLGASLTEVVMELGLGHMLVGIDTFSIDVPGVPDVQLFDMWAIDAESLLVLQPDVILASGLMDVSPAGPFGAVMDAGTAVVSIPTAATLAEIMDDITFLGDLLNVQPQAAQVVAWMQDEIAQLAHFGVANGSLRVYFELEPAPMMFSFGSGVFLDEILRKLGAVNIFGDSEGWIMVSDEEIFAANPDVIITNTFWGDPIQDILARPWAGISAIDNGRVYRVDANSTSRPSHNVVHGMWELARILGD